MLLWTLNEIMNGKRWAPPLAPRNAQQPSLEWWQPLLLLVHCNTLRNVQPKERCAQAHVYYRLTVSHHASPFYLNWGFSRTLSAFRPLSPHLLEAGSKRGADCLPPQDSTNASSQSAPNTFLSQLRLEKKDKLGLEAVLAWHSVANNRNTI